MARRLLPLLVIGLLLIATAASAAPTAPDSASTDTTAKPKRTMQDIMKDFQETGQQLQGVITSLDSITNPQKRKEAAPKAVPVLKKMVGFLHELRDSGDAQGKMIADQMESQLVPILAVFGDKQTRAEIEKQARSDNKEEALKGQSNLLLVKWIETSKDPKAQEKVADEAEQLAKANDSSEPLTEQLFAMGQLGPASPQLADRAQDIAIGMHNGTAERMKQQVADQKKLRSLEDKPLTIAGVRNDGSQFSTADWNGKVILVDFWATWCGPCRAELPRVKKAYADFHEKGLEVLGVSCDNDGDALAQFLHANPDMPWPQLFDAKSPGWHALAKSYGINGIPTMFLIDKKGVVRTVTARENFEEMIPKLLAEK